MRKFIGFKDTDHCASCGDETLVEVDMDLDRSFCCDSRIVGATTPGLCEIGICSHM